MTFNTQAIILSRRDFREADLEVVFLSKDFGKISAVAHGAKKITSKLAGNLEPWREVKIMLADGKHFDKIGQVQMLNNFGIHQTTDLSALTQAQKAMSLTNKLLGERQNEKGLYDFLNNFLECNFLAKFSKNLSKSLIFGWQLLNYIGLTPQVKSCLHCGCKLGIEQTFLDFSGGGLSCVACAKGLEKKQALGVSATGWIKAFQIYNFNELLNKAISPLTHRELDFALDSFIKFHS